MLAIDIGTKTICVVEGSQRSNGVVITACAEAEYESELVTGGAIADRTGLGFLINQLIKTNRMKSKAAVVTFHSNDIVTRELKMPEVKLPQLRQLVYNEMTRILGEDSGYTIDFTVGGQSEDKQLNITAYAVPEDLVEGYYKLLTDLKLKPVALDIQSNSLTKLLTGSSINGTPLNSGNIIVADIGYSKISFHGFSGGYSRFNRADLSPMQEFVREVGSVQRADVDQKLLSGLDFSPDAEQDNVIITDTCRYFVYRLSEEIQRYEQYLYMNSELKTIEKLYICGGAACLKGIDAALSEHLRIPVSVIRSVDKIQSSSRCDVATICCAAGALIRS